MEPHWQTHNPLGAGMDLYKKALIIYGVFLILNGGNNRS
jgi:hypothetical protein